MRIAIIGHGKMGKAIEQVATERGHSIVARIGRAGGAQLDALSPEAADVAIEFTRPDAALENLKTLTANRLPTVVGTTGWLHRIDEVRQMAEASGVRMVYASNFSVGVNLLFSINRLMARMMNPHPEYDVFVEERHHRHKLDAPGGTARSLAEDVIAGLDRKDRIAPPHELQHRAPLPGELSVGFVRAGEIPGTHRVVYTSGIDKLEIQHEAYGRGGFALGAVIAAERLHTLPPGLHNFADWFDPDKQK